MVDTALSMIIKGVGGSVPVYFRHVYSRPPLHLFSTPLILLLRLPYTPSRFLVLFSVDVGLCS